MCSSYLVGVAVNGVKVVVDQVTKVQTGDVRVSTARSNENKRTRRRAEERTKTDDRRQKSLTNRCSRHCMKPGLTK